MITPFFTVTQDEGFVYVKVKISNIRFSSEGLEMVIDDNLFVFYMSPYYLRLRFPCCVVDDEKCHAEFSSQEESINIKISKSKEGEFFPDLDLTTKLLARANESQVKVGGLEGVAEQDAPDILKIDGAKEKPHKGKPLIQELDVEMNVEGNGQNQQDMNWEIPQTMPQETLEKPRYGFNNAYEGMVQVSVMNGNDINELSAPDETLADDRITQRLIKENIKFDMEYYASGFMLEDEIKDLIDWRNPVTRGFQKWAKSQSEAKKNGSTELEIFPALEFTESEQKTFLDLPRKSYLIQDPRPNYYLILCILFATNFDLRSNEGDSTVESPWTIGKMCPQFSFLDSQLMPSNNESEGDMLRVTMITLMRRALSYPLYRNFSLVQKTFDDVYYALRCGKKQVLRQCVAAREMFRCHDVYYVYSKIWLDDLCAWIMSDGCTNGALRTLAHDMKKQEISKKDVTFEKIFEDEFEVVNLEDIELLAQQ